VSQTKRPRNSSARERLKRENDRLRRELAERERQLAEAQQRIADAQKHIADLERQLALRQQNSTTTSKPPSSDGLAGRQRERGRRTKSRRKPGGQPGHPGHSRPLVPAERANETVDLVPAVCRHCQHRLHARDTVGEPRRHQVTELPAIEAHITEYRCHRLRCRACGGATQAPLPDEIEGQFGPQLTALIAYLTVVCRLPRLVVQRLLEGALQIPISLGSTQKAWEETSAAVGAPYAELQAALPIQAVLNADETGHRTNAAKRWLWTLVAPTFVFYTIATSRGSDVLRRLLGATFAGILGSDRLLTYTTYAARQRQYCWSHLTRNLLSAQELARTAAGKRFCREALALQRRLFRLWHRFRGDPRVRGGPITREQLIAKACSLEKAFFALAERSVNVADLDASNLARALFEHHPHFFTFVHEEGVEPTNDVAERALRHAAQDQLWQSQRGR
jgi:transposase